MVDRLPPVHPGEILKEEFLKPMGISQYRLAKELHLSEYRISKIIRGKASITADTAVRLAVFFSTTPDLWVNLQKRYDIKMAEAEFYRQKIKIKPLELALA